MPKVPSPQIRKIHDVLWNQFKETELKRPQYNSTYAKCLVCGSRALLPRQMGNICSSCKKKKEEKVIVDDETRKFLRKRPGFRRRAQY